MTRSPILSNGGQKDEKDDHPCPRGDHNNIHQEAPLTSIGWVSSKLTSDSAGRTTSLFPVNAAPPAPAPPPAAIPIAAPLPPPARAPIIPPSAAPPPAITAVRLPLPLTEKVRAAACTGTSLPFNAMDSRRSCSI